jgi:hypothetical protein
MSRYSRYSSEGATADLVSVVLLGAGILMLVVMVLVVCLVAELWRIFKAHAFTPGQAGRVLWAALAGLCGLLLLAGLLAAQPSTMSYAAPLVCWSIFVFILVCEVTDRRFRPIAPAVPKQLSLADVVSWELPTKQPQQSVSVVSQEGARDTYVANAA